MQMLKECLASERRGIVFGKDVQRGTLLHFRSLIESKEHYQINYEYFICTIIAMPTVF